MRFLILCVAMIGMATGCGGGDDGASEPAGGGSGERTTVDPCGLITEAEVSEILGTPAVAEQRDPAGPFVNCSYNTGDVSIGVAASDTIILAPGQADECPPLDIGDEAYDCPGNVAFLSKGHHVSVKTISRTTQEQLAAVARIIESNLP